MIRQGDLLGDTVFLTIQALGNCWSTCAKLSFFILNLNYASCSDYLKCLKLKFSITKAK